MLCRIAALVSFVGLLAVVAVSAATAQQRDPCEWQSHWRRIVDNTGGRWSSQPQLVTSSDSLWAVKEEPFLSASLQSGETRVVAALSEEGTQIGLREEGIRAIDVTSGNDKWVFPRSTAYGSNIEPSTWLCGSDDPVVCREVPTDLDLEAIYLPTRIVPYESESSPERSRAPQPDSVSAIDIETGNVVWYYQFDSADNEDGGPIPPCSPILLDADANGRERKLLVQLRGSHAPVFLDRETGAPIWSLMRAWESTR